MTPTDRAFATGAIKRAPLYVGLTIAGVIAGAGLGTYALWRMTQDPSYPAAPTLIIAVLVLLNARQNLRQFRYVRLLRQLLPPEETRD
jgi:hypothetical protein